jgi:hypothetical protein
MFSGFCGSVTQVMVFWVFTPCIIVGSDISQELGAPLVRSTELGSSGC